MTVQIPPVPTIATSAPAWVAPGPGSWSHDTGHLPGTIQPYMAALLPAAMTAGFRQGFAAYGVPLDAIELAVVRHRLYGQARPVGAPPARDGGGGPPPEIVLRVLLRVHPEMRRRAAAAAATFANARWRTDLAGWQTDEAPRWRRANRAWQQTDPDTLDDAGLAAHIHALNQAFVEATTRHFALIPAKTLPVGEWIAQTREWTGATPNEILAALRGASTASAGPAAHLATLAGIIRTVPAAMAAVKSQAGDARHRLAQLRASAPSVAAALDAYLDEYGWRSATGLTLADRTLMEMPEVLLNSIAASMDRPADDAQAAADGAVAGLRARIPAAHRPAWERLLADARLLYGLRDAEGGLGMLWRGGLLRRALLAAGRRLAARGALAAVEDLWEATPREVAALLGAGPGPAPTDLAARAAERRAAELDTPPATLGPPAGGPPSPDLFPPALGRLMRAFMTYSTLMDGEDSHPAAPAAPAAPARTGLEGRAASAGRYAGPARLVLTPADFDRVRSGDVLVTQTTSPAYNILLPLLGAVVTDSGGVLCHAALVAREFGIPAVVGTRTATSTIADGAWVVVDGTRGTVEIGS
ncbi:MAG TPA: PEP-utilizing enzyme [Chloroflexia bacterium]|nr:PEP-utilizing enzyme [Chloroflexia bacterium]